MGRQILGSGFASFEWPVDFCGLELVLVENLLLSSLPGFWEADKSLSAVWQGTLILLLCCSPVSGNDHCLFLGPGKEQSRACQRQYSSPAWFMCCGVFLVLAETCSLSRAVLIALKYFLQLFCYRYSCFMQSGLALLESKFTSMQMNLDKPKADYKGDRPFLNIFSWCYL